MARGDHIVSERIGYAHHGIDCGDGTVIHYSGAAREKRDALVRRTPLDDFARGAAVTLVQHEEADDPETVVGRAESRLGERRYNLFKNNCEHFAVWCKTGRSRSGQVTRTVRAALGTGLAAGLLLGLRIATRLAGRSRTAGGA